MIRARVLTTWIGTGQAGNPFRPRLADEYSVATCMDVTGQPAGKLIPNPNLFTVEITCSEAVYGAMAADANYTVLWSETV